MFVFEIRDVDVLDFLADDLGDFLDPVVGVVRADVVDRFGPRVRLADGVSVRPGGVRDVDERAPV